MIRLDESEISPETLGPPTADSLAHELDRVYRKLAPGGQLAPGGPNEPSASSGGELYTSESGAALAHLVSVFGLTDFERDLLLLCVGATLESRFRSACAAHHAEGWPTLRLALSAFNDSHWSAISRVRPLRYWRLIEVDARSPLDAALRIDERILHFLLGIPTIDDRLEALIRPLHRNSSAESSDAALTDAERAAAARWRQPYPGQEPVLLVATFDSVRKAAFQSLCRLVQRRPCVLDAGDIPGHPAEREQLARLWNREAALTGAALLIQTNDSDTATNLSAFLRLIESPVAVAVPAGSGAERLDGIRIHLNGITLADRQRIWKEHLVPVINLSSPASRNDVAFMIDRVIDHFPFDEPDTRIVASTSANRIAHHPGPEVPTEEIAWNTCRFHARRSMENLAQRIEARAGWSDLVLPEQQLDTLRHIVVQVRQRAVVHRLWGFADRYERGLGLSALFSGTSGTGKTMAAEIIAAALHLDLYRIDLASTVSKYIGETEKNLRRIFDAAEQSSAILFFDEADALFGKRSEVRDSHDRYANLEVSYLLQRIESYRGVAILTTNMPQSLDPAFLRRIRFIVPFPFPDAESRTRIWKSVFPQTTPLGAIQFERLAQMNVSGGVIRNIATHAAFIAAEDRQPVGMKHLFAAARLEYAKLDKPLTEAETRGWL
jgi:hypothetical protein